MRFLRLIYAMLRKKVPGTFFMVCLPAFAQSQLAQNIAVKDNPRFLPHFLERFSDGFRAQTHFPQPEMPAKLRAFWFENMSTPRDFAEEIFPGVLWPRFQWGIHTGSEAPGQQPQILPIYQWFDVKNPERLVREWNRAFCFEKEKSYIGVAWTGDRGLYEFFSRDKKGLSVRRYKNGKFAGEYKIEIDLDTKPVAGASTRPTLIAKSDRGETLYTLTPVGRTPPRLRATHAAHLQVRIQREFLIFPRSYAKSRDWERVYFP